MSEQERLTPAEYRALVQSHAGSGPKTRKRPSSPKTRRSIVIERADSLITRIRRLMDHRALSSRLRIKPEERLAIDFANALRALTIEGRLRCVWTHPANEVAGQQSGLAQIRYAIAKAMGLIDGTPDYLFLSRTGSAALEAKVGSNGQQPNQIDFERWCASVGVEYATFRSVEEGLSHLTRWGLLSDEPRSWREGREEDEA